METALETPKIVEITKLRDEPDRDFFNWSPEKLKHYGIELPRHGKGTFEEIMALVDTFTHISEEDDLYTAIMEDRAERRKHLVEKSN